MGRPGERASVRSDAQRRRVQGQRSAPADTQRAHSHTDHCKRALWGSWCRKSHKPSGSRRPTDHERRTVAHSMGLGQWHTLCTLARLVVAAISHAQGALLLLPAPSRARSSGQRSRSPAKQRSHLRSQRDAVVLIFAAVCRNLLANGASVHGRHPGVVGRVRWLGFGGRHLLLHLAPTLHLGIVICLLLWPAVVLKISNHPPDMWHTCVGHNASCAVWRGCT